MKLAPVLEERRCATVLFADLSGFTGLSEHMDPEDVRGVVDACMGTMTTITERYGGVTTRVTGDVLMVVFGAPLAHEDDAERAVRAALELQRYAAAGPEDLGGLTLRVGINTGEVMVATVGHERDATVMGDVVNVASRLQGMGSRGGILAGEETRLTRRAIRYEPVEALSLKGKGEPLFLPPHGGPGG